MLGANIYKIEADKAKKKVGYVGESGYVGNSGYSGYCPEHFYSECYEPMIKIEIE